MYFSSRTEEAIRLASRLHRHQTRFDNERTPYISHLVSVAMMLSKATEDEDIIIAGLMHDSLEDVPLYTYEKLVEDMGERVANIVKHVTEPLDANKEKEEQIPWLERKDAYLISLREGGKESAMVSCADKIHNTESFLFDYEKEGETFLLRFGSSLRNKLWFHEQVLSIVKEKLGEDIPLVKRFVKCNEEFKKLVPVMEK